MDQHYAQTHYIEDLEALIKKHELELVVRSAEHEAAKGFQDKLKAECDNLVEELKKIDADENFEFDQSLKQKRKDLSEELIFRWGKFMWFRDKVAECESKKETIQAELHKLCMQRLHISVFHNK